MKSSFYTVAVVVGFCGLSGIAGLRPAAAQTSAPTAEIAPIVREMDGNAGAADRNAAIYQWVRVNREVDRVVAGEHRLAQSLPATGASPAAVQSLQEAVRDLRAARLAHDPKRLSAASQRVIVACRPLE